MEKCAEISAFANIALRANINAVTDMCVLLREQRTKSDDGILAGVIKYQAIESGA